MLQSGDGCIWALRTPMDTHHVLVTVQGDKISQLNSECCKTVCQPYSIGLTSYFLYLSLRYHHSTSYIPSAMGFLSVGGCASQNPCILNPSAQFVQIPPPCSKASLGSPVVWQPNPSNAPRMSIKYREFCCNESMSDILLQVGGKQFPAHRVLLAAASTKFLKLFERMSKVNGTQVINCCLKISSNSLLHWYVYMGTIIGALSTACWKDLLKAVSLQLK